MEFQSKQVNKQTKLFACEIYGETSLMKKREGKGSESPNNEQSIQSKNQKY